MKNKPLYVISLFEKGHYSKDDAWKGVPLDKATQLNHKEANIITTRLQALGHKAALEPVNSLAQKNPS